MDRDNGVTTYTIAVISEPSVQVSFIIVGAGEYLSSFHINTMFSLHYDKRKGNK